MVEHIEVDQIQNMDDEFISSIKRLAISFAIERKTMRESKALDTYVHRPAAHITSINEWVPLTPPESHEFRSISGDEASVSVCSTRQKINDWLSTIGAGSEGDVAEVGAPVLE